MTRTHRREGAITGAVLVGTMAFWIVNEADAFVWVSGTVVTNTLVRYGSIPVGGHPISAPLFDRGSTTDPLSWRLPIELVIVCGCTRRERPKPLAHDTRRRIHDVVESEPGVFLSSLADRLDVSLSTVRHHVRVLEDESLLASRKINGRRRYYPDDPDDPTLLAALGDSATATVLDTLDRVGPTTVSELADALERDPSTVSHHLTRLADDGLVERERRGRTVVSRLSPDVRSTLECVIGGRRFHRRDG